MTIEEGILTEEELLKIDGDHTRRVVDFLGKNPNDLCTSEKISKETGIESAIVNSILGELESKKVTRRRFVDHKDFYGLRQ